MRLGFSARAWEDYLHWQAADPKMLARVNALIDDARRTPFEGIGKPEALKGDLAGWWSRRINHEHRLVYQVRGTAAEQTLWLAACCYHH